MTNVISSFHSDPTLNPQERGCRAVGADDLGVQWQLDTSGSPLTFNEWIDNVKLTVQ